MQVANRTTRRYITPPTKTAAGNIRPTSKKQSHVPAASHSSPKKAPEPLASKSNDNSTLKKLVDRFRYDEPQPRPERDSINSDFWWLHDELKTTCESNVDDDDDERKSNIPEFIEIFPSTDIDQDLNKRASLLLNQTFSAHSSDVGHVSSTGIGSTPSTTMTTTTMSTFQPAVHEQPARPIFTRITDSKFDFKVNGGSSDEDILYQWRLRRRLEQAQNNEPITFPSKITNQNNILPARSHFPPIPIEIPTVISPPPPTVVESAPPKQEKSTSETPITKLEDTKQPTTVPLPIRQYSEATTQTLQDACIQTSPTVENSLSISTVVPNDVYLRPTRDDYDDHSSVWHRPPPRSKSETTRISSSPSPIKRHHHHHPHHSFRPVIVTGHPVSTHTPHQRSVVYPSTTVQSSQDSTLTQVTSIMTNENHHPTNTDHQYQMRNRNRVAMIDATQIQNQDDGNEDIDDPVQYYNDEILNILIQKRDELLVTFREIEQRLANMNS